MILTWHNDKVPEGIKIKQVYGLLFMKDGRMLLRIEDGFHSLAGGKPESGEDMIATLKREVIEEVNTTIYDPIYLGYQLVDRVHLTLNFEVKLLETSDNNSSFLAG